MKIHKQLSEHDCGVSALATYLGISYGDVYVAGAIVAPGFVQDGGLSIDNLRDIAKSYGRKLERVHWRRVDLAKHSGILGVLWDKSQWRKHGCRGHWVVLSAGTIIDTSDLSYDKAEAYLKKNKGRAGTLLQLCE